MVFAFMKTAYKFLREFAINDTWDISIFIVFEFLKIGNMDVG